MAESMVVISDLWFAYRGGDFVLGVPELTIARGRAVACTGPSGSGKTTLLNLVAGIIRPDRGRVFVEGTDVAVLDDRARRGFRAKSIGLVFQGFELLSYLSVLDNILLPYRIAPGLVLDAAARERAATLARSVGIGDKLGRTVSRLSHGEQQRVTLCRALVTRPGLLLADEPTGSLDPANKHRVIELLLRCAREAHATLVMVTHDHELLEHFDEVIDFSRFTGAAGRIDAPRVEVRA
ncbi:MAG: ABC transporter ATP-binding protein [Planctomycetota bacterium]|jgi:putative ABC transport system ATP-binding protein